jgi:hypothetical protein
MVVDLVGLQHRKVVDLEALQHHIVVVLGTVVQVGRIVGLEALRRKGPQREKPLVVQTQVSVAQTVVLQ